ncbi:hypothetical protein [Kribbia dieselivorans]|uniref:hypothetical protein n=1 Tax=Kribbia dieselivorans TaxID=331526 RepID=UPI0008383F9B|nr:hypothetical protein [Kribbia dieselivorans]
MNNEPKRHDPARPYPQEPPQQIITGPSPTALAGGLILLALSLLVIVDQLLGYDANWRHLIPWLVIGAGALGLVLGIVGMLSSRD